MNAIHFSWQQLMGELPEFAPVPVPVGAPVSMVRSASHQAPGPAPANTRAGVWECTPGTWLRQVRQAEFCHFLEGRALFVPADGGAPMQIAAGDVVYFPRDSLGEWTILETSRKIYILFDESQSA